MPPEIFTPKDLDDNVKKIGETKSETKILNSNLKEWNELFKTINSIAENFGFSIREIMQARKDKPVDVATKIESGIEKRMSSMQQQNPEAMVKGDLHIAIQKIKTDLAAFLLQQKEQNPEITLKDIVDMYGEWDKAGIVDGFIENQIKKYVVVK